MVLAICPSKEMSTSEGIAARAGLDERYVREWRGAMVTGGVVDMDPASNLYSLPAEHAAYLTRAAAADNMAVFGQYIARMGCVEEDIGECFRNGGGGCRTRSSLASTRRWRRTVASRYFPRWTRTSCRWCRW